MQAVVLEEHGVMSLNYMWLPTWIGMNSMLVNELNALLSERLVGMPADDALTVGHMLVVDTLCKRYPLIKGMREYLDALHPVHFDVELPGS